MTELEAIFWFTAGLLYGWILSTIARLFGKLVHARREISEQITEVLASWKELRDDAPTVHRIDPPKEDR